MVWPPVLFYRLRVPTRHGAKVAMFGCKTPNGRAIGLVDNNRVVIILRHDVPPIGRPRCRLVGIVIRYQFHVGVNAVILISQGPFSLVRSGIEIGHLLNHAPQQSFEGRREHPGCRFNRLFDFLSLLFGTAS